MPAYLPDGQIPAKAPHREPATSRVTSRKQTNTDPESQPQASQVQTHSHAKQALHPQAKPDQEGILIDLQSDGGEDAVAVLADGLGHLDERGQSGAAGLAAPGAMSSTVWSGSTSPWKIAREASFMR